MAFARIVETLAGGGTFELFGNTSRAFTYVGDVVEATIAALGAAPGIYNVGGGEEATMREAIALLEEVADRTLALTTGPPQVGDMKRTMADTTRIERELGWRATTSLRDGLSEHWQWASARVGTR
jgi:nucleoside-diphosphate-sugar epimerase